MSENEIVDNTETNEDTNLEINIDPASPEGDEGVVQDVVIEDNIGELGNELKVTKEEKPLNTTNPEEAKAATSDLEIFGNPNCWVLISKASSKSGNWMKSTKAMFVDNGCILQVTTQLGEDTSEALTYVPGVQIGKVGGFPALVKL